MTNEQTNKKNIINGVDYSFMDIKAVEAEITEKEKQQSHEFRDRMHAMGDKVKADQNEMNELFARVILSEREEAEQKRTEEIEAEKARAIAEIEQKYDETTGVKSSKTKTLNDGYRSLLGNLPGMRD